MFGFEAPLLFEAPIFYSSFVNYSSGIRWTRVTTSWVPTCKYKRMLGFSFFSFLSFLPLFLLHSLPRSFLPLFHPSFLLFSCGGQRRTCKSQFYSSTLWVLETQLGSAALVANTSIFWSVSLAPLNICGCFGCCCLVLLLSFSWGFMFGCFLR